MFYYVRYPSRVRNLSRAARNHGYCLSTMIQFARVVGSFNYRQVAGIDDHAVYVVERRSSGLLSEHYSHSIALSALTRVDFIRETRWDRIRRGLLLFLSSAAFIALVVLGFRRGVLFLPVTGTAIVGYVVAPLTVVWGLVSCFRPRGMHLVFVADGRRYQRVLSAREWKLHQTELLRVLLAANVRCEHYGDH